MDFCVNCGNKLNSNEDYCSNCGTYINNNKIEVNDINEDNKKKLEKSKKNAIISLVLALMPILLLYFCYIYSYGSFDENGEGAVWWLLLIYYGTVGIPIAIIALYLAINSCKIQKNMLAILSIFIDVLPYLFFILLPLIIA